MLLTHWGLIKMSIMQSPERKCLYFYSNVPEAFPVDQWFYYWLGYQAINWSMLTSCINVDPVLQRHMASLDFSELTILYSGYLGYLQYLEACLCMPGSLKFPAGIPVQVTLFNERSICPACLHDTLLMQTKLAFSAILGSDESLRPISNINTIFPGMGIIITTILTLWLEFLYW